MQNEDEVEPPGKTMVIWESPQFVMDVDTSSTTRSYSLMLEIGHAVQRDDYTKQPPDKITLELWNPQAQTSMILGMCVTKLNLLPCVRYSSLHTIMQLISSGLCLASFLASHPGLWPWSRVI